MLPLDALPPVVSPGSPPHRRPSSERDPAQKVGLAYTRALSVNASDRPRFASCRASSARRTVGVAEKAITPARRGFSAGTRRLVHSRAYIIGDDADDDILDGGVVVEWSVAVLTPLARDRSPSPRRLGGARVIENAWTPFGERVDVGRARCRRWPRNVQFLRGRPVAGPARARAYVASVRRGALHTVARGRGQSGRPRARRPGTSARGRPGSRAGSGDAEPAGCRPRRNAARRRAGGAT